MDCGAYQPHVAGIIVAQMTRRALAATYNMLIDLRSWTLALRYPLWHVGLEVPALGVLRVSGEAIELR